MINLFLLALFFTVVPGVFLSIVCKKRIEYFLATSLMGSALLLYAGGWLKCLKASLYINNILIIGMLLFSICTIVRQKIRKNDDFFKDLSTNILTPGLLLFFCGVIFSIFISHNHIFYRFDEYSHWGRIVNVLLQYDALPLRNQEAAKRIIFQDYPPAAALIEYMFVKASFLNAWQGVASFALQVTYVAIFVFFTAKSKWKHFGVTLLCILTIYCVCINIDSTSFSSIHVDNFLGCVFAMMCFLSIGRLSIVCRSILLFVVAAFLMLTKTSGVGLAVIAFIPSVFDSIKCLCMLFKKGKGDNRITYFLISLVPFLAFIFHILQKMLKKTAYLSNKISLNNVLDLFVFGEPEKFDIIFNKWFDFVFIAKKFTICIIPTSYFLCAVTLSFLIFILARNYKDQMKHKMSMISVLFFIGFCCYAVTLLFLYVFRTSDYEGKMLHSFDRYIGTYILSGIILLFACALDYICTAKKSSKYYFLLLFVPFAATAGTSYKTTRNFLNVGRLNSQMSWLAAAREVIDPTVGAKEKFFGVFQSSRSYHEVIFKATHINFTTGGPWGPRQFEGDVWTRNVSESFFSNLIKNNDYCYVHTSSDSFVDKYGKFFSCEKIIDRCLYKSENGKLYPLTNKQFCFDFKNVSLLRIQNKKRAMSEYSAFQSAQIVKLMDNGFIELKNINNLPLSNGDVDAVEIEFSDISGRSDFKFIINDIVYAEKKLDLTSSGVIKVSFAPVTVENIILRFVTEKERAALKIKRIFLHYSKEKSPKRKTVLEFDQNNQVHQPDIFDWRGDARKILSSGFSSTGKKIILFGERFYSIPDTGNISISARIKNSGKKNTSIYWGFNVLDSKMRRISGAASAVTDTNTILSQPAKKGDKQIFVSSVKNWKKKGRRVAFYASPDYSDLPNYTYLDCGTAWISDYSQVSENEFCVKLKEPLMCDLPKGIGVRQHNMGMYNYLYLAAGILKPGEEKVWSGTIVNKNRLPGFNISNGWPIGSKYAQLVLLSYSSEEHDIEVKDVKVKFSPN